MTRSSVSMGLSAQSGSDFAKTLPGVTGPLDFFDPLGLTEELTKEEVLRFREAELAHGRVSMVAALGFLVQENFHPLFPDIGGSAARQLDTVLQTETGQGIMASLLFTVMLTEIQRARVGWMPPSEGMQQLRPEYVPGDLGFDPLGMRPSSDADLLAMKNKELNNGRLAMLAVAYFAAEEVLGGTPELLGSA
ncbi:light harvesting protein [Emiliania huxleyi CCMP1516]|uniref:Light harvesting protein n=3 Tax=Emiliania huxleyi TaxID=2903 RepID=A0A0D3JPX5_EMIH1|nr:light harvesting protein [Emiliania huxleyi CCMP1516]EOD25560.1 light harvesting protein [Emiliania huxleyi CCMP1516]|eukprot:XP_005777989.1 light harvesting protein [Emiliania huxleyi CCMP1516]